jgi:predicted nucleic acid-binding protein
MRLLLDVSVLVALLDEAHVYQAVAQNLIAQPNLRIATCAPTENGVLRVLNLPG